MFFKDESFQDYDHAKPNEFAKYSGLSLGLDSMFYLLSIFSSFFAACALSCVSLSDLHSTDMQHCRVQKFVKQLLPVASEGGDIWKS